MLLLILPALNPSRPIGRPIEYQTHITHIHSAYTIYTMDASCQCGSVTFKTPLEKPLALYICHCTECRRQTSSAFGTSAIFPRFALPDAELLSVYK